MVPLTPTELISSLVPGIFYTTTQKKLLHRESSQKNMSHKEIMGMALAGKTDVLHQATVRIGTMFKD